MVDSNVLVNSEEVPEVQSIDELVQRVESYYPKDIDISILRTAFQFSENAHQGQIRRSGEAYISHPLSVAGILADLKMDISTIIAGLLHDTVEDTHATLEDLNKLFGSEVAQLVDGVTKISKISFKSTHQKQGENIRKMIVAMGKDIRVVIVKIADRLHNMRTLTHMPFEKQATIAEETLEIYAPLANRLGISTWKTELEDLSFRYLKPEMYYNLAQRVTKKRTEREQYIRSVVEMIRAEMTKYGLDGEIQGRPKHLYSIFKKMQSKNLEYDQLYDVLALRVLVDTVPQCYEALGLVHQLFKPIPGRFKDFIAMPKSNNYQSLHTVIVGPDGERIEIQIRTKQMHQVAERGIAAHWRYKEGIARNLNEENKFNWLRELVTWHQQLRDSDEFLETVKSDLFSQEIYVFTPKGEVREFPEGATPLDFSYSIHTDLGNKTVGAKVNGRIVPLKHRLENGDTIEIITAASQQPSKDWLKFCVTTRAQTKIKQYIRNEERRRAAEMGAEIFEKEARKYGISIQRFKDTPDLERVLKAFGVTTLEEVYIQVGYGKILAGKFIEALAPEAKAPQAPQEPESFLSKVVKSALNKTRKSGSLVTVDGIGDMLVRYARCCNPIPGDPIIGAISRGRGVTIHQATCRRVFEVDPERRVHVEWAKNMEASRQTRIRVISQDVPGLLKQMTDVFATNGININHADISTSREKRAICNFDVTVKNKSQVLKVVSDLSKIRGVLQVDRISHE